MSAIVRAQQSGTRGVPGRCGVGVVEIVILRGLLLDPICFNA